MEKDIFTIRENTLSYGWGYVYSLQYHLVWCTKYRKKVLTDGLDTECKEMLQKLAEEYRFQILAMEVMPDHIHLLVDCKPQFFYFWYDKNHERKSGKTNVSCTSGIKAAVVGRASVESILLRSDSQWSEQGTGTGIHGGAERKRKAKKLENEVLSCGLHPVMAWK